MLKSHAFYFILFSIFFISNVQARELLPPRFSANASTGVYTVGQADLMISLDGDRQHNLYVNPQGAYGSDQQWYGDVGLGYRWIKNESAILGWYLFAGHTCAENSSGFWITNPGLEVMGSRWDARINAYIPVAGRSNELGIRRFNVVNTVFTGHTEIRNSVFNDANAIQQVGNGMDARVGYQLFRTVPLKGYLGAYFFGIANADNVCGGAAGMEYWVNDNIRVFANYSYDNYQHNHVVGGVGISFGGVRKHWTDPGLSERLTDPVERYLANLGHGSAGIPSKTFLYGIGGGSSRVLVSDSIAFFSQTGTPNGGGVGLTLANCTFENPCGPTDFSQTGVNTLNILLPNTDFYFNGGAYPAAAGVNTALTLNNGQSVFSRTANYSAPATGAARSTFNGAFNLLGNNTLDGVILVNTAVSDIGINVSGANNVLISNSVIGGANTTYETGMSIASGGSVTLENSIINSSEFAIELNNASLLMQSSVINVNSATAPAGIDATNSNAQVNDSQINVVGLVGNIVTIGVLSQSGSVTMNRSNLDVRNNDPASTTEGLLTTGGGSITMNSGTLSVSGGMSTTLASGPNINLSNVVCILNGTMVVCP
jgi:hypothetical protein